VSRWRHLCGPEGAPASSPVTSGLRHQRSPDWLNRQRPLTLRTHNLNHEVCR
jgi:hypothetical protein